MYKLRNYQEKYIHELKEKVEEYLNLESNKICVFKSPTGSGKTIMMAEIIKRLVENRTDGKELAFIWITVHKLHDQSKEKLEEYYENFQTVICSYFEDLQDKQIQDKEILFFNWQSINQGCCYLLGYFYSCYPSVDKEFLYVLYLLIFQ